ncbi:MAG: GNAT family N-acetyltransferase [Anaerolineales bacterium]|nr:GNAT family N-acetyltransferase [Anaerolineales bacterium]
MSAQTDLHVVLAGPEHWDDLLEFFERIPCTCQYWRVSSSEYRGSKNEGLDAWVAARRAALRAQLEDSTPPGVLAYLEGQLVGWCGFGPRPQMGRLVRSRTIPKVDDQPVWSVVCFIVRTGFRRRGITGALLQGVIDCARQHGAPGLEAYPVDPEGKRISGAFAYVGTTSMFERAGFRRVLLTDSTSAKLPRWLMRLETSN